MIVLDEQLMGRGIETEISHWYSGPVRFVNDLRPGTIIKDEAIPALLAQNDGTTFVTINVGDFWQRLSMNSRCCIVCVDLSDSRANQIPSLLKRLLSYKAFRTKSLRKGHMVRLTNSVATYYSASDKTLRTIEDW